MTADQVARDLCRVIDDVPVGFKLNGVRYVGTRGPIRKSKQLVSGGVFELPNLSIATCLKKLQGARLVDRFPTDGEPQPQNTLTDVGDVAGQDFRIVTTHTDEFGVGLQMDLESVHK